MYILLDLFKHLEYNVPVQRRTEIKLALLLTLHIQSTHNPLHNFLDETRERTRQNTLKLRFHTMDTWKLQHNLHFHDLGAEGTKRAEAEERAYA